MRRLARIFSSIKLAIVLLIVLAAASILGTLIPQGRRAEDYAARYGALSGTLIKLQLTGLYHSAWYLGLLGLFAANIVVCTLTRLGAKIRRAARPRIENDPAGLPAMRMNDRLRKNAALAAVRSEVEGRLAASRYRVRSESAGPRVHVLARKRIGGVFGADVVHAGLLFILAGGIVTGALGFRRDLELKPGDVVPIPDAGFALRLDKFDTLRYPDGSVKSWISTITVTDAGRAVRTRAVEVNHPLSFRGYSFYQMSYGWNWESPVLEIWVRKTTDAAFLKKVRLKPGQRTLVDETARTSVAVRSFLPDFVLGRDNRPETRSLQPNNPAALVEEFRGEEKTDSTWVFANYPDFAQMHAAGAKPGTAASTLKLELKDFEADPISILQAAKDPGVGLIWAGCALIMLGLGLAFYWPTWEIRAVLEESGGRTEITLGGLAAKSKDAFRAEFAGISAALRRAQ